MMRQQKRAWLSVTVGLCVLALHAAAEAAPLKVTRRPLAITKCPPVGTRCPKSATRCPSCSVKTVPTFAPAIRTQCPRAASKCPAGWCLKPVITRRPAKATRCPQARTRCPQVTTECPQQITVCPRHLPYTMHAKIVTHCPISPTMCPQSATQCPECVVIPSTVVPIVTTRCPTVRTSCPAIQSICTSAYGCVQPGVTVVAKQTECPTAETLCPALQTYCPRQYTRCPIDVPCIGTTPTVTPAKTTRCPQVATQCVAVQTLCPPSPTVCPQSATRCPAIGTRCPLCVIVPPTQSPLPTACRAAKTQCPWQVTRCPVSAQCPVGWIPAGGAIRRGASEKGKAFLRAAAKRNAQLLLGQFALQHRVQVGLLERDLAAARAAVWAAVQKQPGWIPFLQQFQRLRAYMGRAAGMPTGPMRNLALKAGEKAIAALLSNHAAMFRAAHARASFDRASAAQALGAYIPRLDRLPRGGDDDDDDDPILIDPRRLVYAVHALPESDPPAPPQTSFRLDPPFPETATHESGAPYDCEVRDGNRVLVFAEIGAAGEVIARATAGDFITVSPGYTRLQVTARVRMDDYHVVAWALGAAGADLDVVLEVTGPTGRTSRRSKEIASVLAPVLWSADESGSGTYTVVKTFTIPGSGGECLVAAGLRACAWAGGFAAAMSRGDCRVEWIAIEALP